MAYDTNRRHRPNSEGQSGKEDEVRSQRSEVSCQRFSICISATPVALDRHLAALPAMSRVPRSPFRFQFSSTPQPLPGPNESEKARLLCTWGL